MQRVQSWQIVSAVRSPIDAACREVVTATRRVTACSQEPIEAACREVETAIRRFRACRSGSELLSYR